jgi:UDP-glucose 4-epimerase
VPAAAGEMINIGSDREITILELARLVWRLVREDEPRITLVPFASFGRYEDVERRIPDNRKAARLLGHVPAVALEEGLPRTIAWQRDAMRKAGLL